MVIADGSVVVANGNGTLVRTDNGREEWSEDTDLYWAVRGGGAGPWGVITHLTIKLHKPRNNCRQSCYTNYNVAWYSRFDADDGGKFGQYNDVGESRHNHNNGSGRGSPNQNNDRRDHDAGGSQHRPSRATTALCFRKLLPDTDRSCGQELR